MSRFERSIGVGLVGQGVITTAATRQAGRARRLDREQRVVDRAEPGARGDHQRQRRGRARGRARGSPGVSGTSRPPTPSHDEHVARRRRARRACATQVVRLDRDRRPARPRGGATPAGRSGTARRPRALPRARRARRAARGRAADSPGSSSRPVTTGLNAATRSPRAASAAQIAAATTVLPTSVSVPVTKTPRNAVLGGVARAPSNTRGSRRPWAAVAPRDGSAPARRRARARRAASRSSAGVCDAITASRSRELPARHGRRADRLGEDAPLERALARSHGRVGVADDQRHDLRVGSARRRGPARRAPRAAPPRCAAACSTRRGCSRSSSSAASAAATAGGGSAGREDQRARAC